MPRSSATLQSGPRILGVWREPAADGAHAATGLVLLNDFDACNAYAGGLERRAVGCPALFVLGSAT